MTGDGGFAAAGSGSRGQDSPADAELLRRHAAGDQDAFSLLFTRHKDRLWAVALRITCDQEDAADALQEAMISAFRRASDFRGESAVTTWLHRIVVNASLDLLRRRSARVPRWSGDLVELQAREPGHVASETGSAFETGSASETSSASDTRLDVEAALRTLPPPQRAALVLVDMLGYSVADAAVILDTSEGTVKSRCARGRAKLLPYLSHLRGDYSPGRNQPVPGSVSAEQGGGA